MKMFKILKCNLKAASKVVGAAEHAWNVSVHAVAFVDEIN